LVHDEDERAAGDAGHELKQVASLFGLQARKFELAGLHIAIGGCEAGKGVANKFSNRLKWLNGEGFEELADDFTGPADQVVVLLCGDDAALFAEAGGGDPAGVEAGNGAEEEVRSFAERFGDADERGFEEVAVRMLCEARGEFVEQSAFAHLRAGADGSNSGTLDAVEQVREVWFAAEEYG
jgi:hypothetical protein